MLVVSAQCSEMQSRQKTKTKHNNSLYARVLKVDRQFLAWNWNKQNDHCFNIRYSKIFWHKNKEQSHCYLEQYSTWTVDLRCSVAGYWIFFRTFHQKLSLRPAVGLFDWLFLCFQTPFGKWLNGSVKAAHRICFWKISVKWTRLYRWPAFSSCCSIDLQLLQPSS